ncbi:MAG: mitochondrial inorganic phosphate carrier [Amphiamblys sp. WSBS2006]|nr:MAG: mitochondrial inorganic phosphate carrier [Amphiamblys sp. WSBS2006]
MSHRYERVSEDDFVLTDDEALAARMKGDAVSALESQTEVSRGKRKGVEEPKKKGLGKLFLIFLLGGFLACSVTHLAVTPIDFQKCFMQKTGKDVVLTKSFLGLVYDQHGFTGIMTGGVPTFIGYGIQGLCKFGLYETAKHIAFELYSVNKKYKFASFPVFSAGAEFVADIGLCPFETLKLKMQEVTVEGGEKIKIPYDSIMKAYTEVTKTGFGSLFTKLVGLWMRQVIYTVVKFCSFEAFTILLYSLVYRLYKKKQGDCSKLLQTAFVFLAGIGAGILCAVTSQPFDTALSRMDPMTFSEAWNQGNLYTGLVARMVQLSLLTGFQWLIYDGVKTFFGAGVQKKTKNTKDNKLEEKED